MCHTSIIEWFIDEISRNSKQFEGKIIEVGSKYVNGSVRPLIEKFCSPREYIGIDIEKGRFVDLVLSAENLLEHFRQESFDIVVSTELLEHVKDWRTVIENMKGVLKCGGRIYISTRSYGFQYHGYPYDFWRYELEDMKEIFSDFKISLLQKDPQANGVFLKALKPINYKPNSLAKIALYSIVTGERTLDIPNSLSI